uniref:Ammonium transporter 1.5 n=2 Tax=Bangiaceae TaxID=31345 RepID=A0A6G5U2B4_PYRYE|nr:ammonium transporter 1.5 [Neopyropia yezoensis]QPB67296.1 ammonium transporter 1.5 [Bangia sp. ESS1]
MAEACEVSADAAAALATAGLSFVGDQLRDACASTAAVAAGVAQLSDALNTAFLLFAGTLIFQMELGFALLVTGAVRHKSAASVMLLHIVTPCVVGLCYYMFGFALGFGSVSDNNNPVVGSTFWVLTPLAAFDTFTSSHSLVLVWFQFTFASVCATILLGAVSERATLLASMVSIVIVGGLAFPVVSHWMWSEYGWLGYGKLTGRLFGSGAFDLAGSGVVHVTGGTSALVGAILVGPRTGRYGDSSQDSFTPHNVTLICQGTFMLWAGFAAFNSASVLTITDNFVAAGRCLVNTLLAGCAGGLTMLLVSRLTSSHYSVLDVMNGVLAGLVGICSSCSVVLPYSALLTGTLCSLIFSGCEKATARLKIDDPVGAAPLHLGAGVGGMVITGFTAYPPFLRDAFPGRDSHPGGLFYGGDSPGRLLGAQLVAVVSIIAVVVLLIVPPLFGLKLIGLLIYTDEEQLMGADEAFHGGAAYNFNTEETSADMLTTWQAATPQMSPRAPAVPQPAWNSSGGGTPALPVKVDDRDGKKLDVSASFRSTKESGGTVETDVADGPRFASFIVTTDSGHRSATRRQHVGSASATARSTSQDPALDIDADDPNESVDAIVPVSVVMNHSF